MNNLLLRGGIAKGELTHNGSVIYGSALIKAVELENNQAKYPRIIIEQSVIEDLPNVKYDKEFNMNLLKKDSNGNYYYTDFIGQCDNLDDQNETLLFIDKMQETIKKGLVNNEEHIRNKYHWLKNDFNNKVIELGLIDKIIEL